MYADLPKLLLEKFSSFREFVLLIHVERIRRKPCRRIQEKSVRAEFASCFCRIRLSRTSSVGSRHRPCSRHQDAVLCPSPPQACSSRFRSPFLVTRPLPLALRCGNTTGCTRSSHGSVPKTFMPVVSGLGNRDKVSGYSSGVLGNGIGTSRVCLVNERYRAGAT